METFIQSFRSKLMSSMPMVLDYQERLKSLNDWWSRISLVGKINSHGIAANILNDMHSTKLKFSELQNRLIHNLVLENLQKRVLDDSSKSQVAIDILVRNLFERTADVGFLATDDDIRAFLLDDSSASTSEAIHQRLREYVKKYSVYDEIIILDTRGRVCAHLDKSNPVSYSTDPLIKETLNISAEYIETFRQTDLQPNQRSSLIYSCRITESNHKDSNVIGVLCLFFRFDNEMKGIFSKLLQNNLDSIITIKDKKNNVIASSNTNKLALGSSIMIHQSPDIITHSKHEYLINQTATHGYQGFYGLGWSGMVMTPLNIACTDSHDKEIEGICEKLLEEAKLFSSELKFIRKSSTIVNHDLRLVVLNGKITAARKEAKEFMPVLEAIKKIGEDIQNIFTDSINNLQMTVIASRLSDVQFMASLAVHIMDRNLYERANDCRWWALTSKFRNTLSQNSLSAADKQAMADILAYINGLYTVYTNLYLYDNQARVVAVSNTHEDNIIGTQLDASSGATATLKICDSQQYIVSPFVETSLYGGRPSYIYNAPITNPENTNEVVGGVGIVFDSEPQFISMLKDSLPKDERGELVEGCFAMFTERSGRIISISHADKGLKPGDKLDIDNTFFTMENGAKTSKLLSFNGVEYTLGVAVSSGYREYKTTGDYSNDVIAFIFVPF